MRVIFLVRKARDSFEDEVSKLGLQRRFQGANAAKLTSITNAQSIFNGHTPERLL